MPGQSKRVLPDPIYGLTLDDVPNLNDITQSLQGLPRMPTSRIVFDEGTAPADYKAAINALYPISYLMGEILDSEYVKTLSVADYSGRTQQYLKAFSGQIDIWEIGNEVNGEWLGKTPDVVSKISAAYDQVRASGGRTAVTLYYNPNCWSKRGNEMLPWAEKNLPSNLRTGLDYVFVSYYEGDCNDYRPSPGEWTGVFEKLHQLFPNAKLGFGETGLSKPVRTGTMKKAQDILRYYYGLRIPVAGFVGGGFWWYAAEDIVPIQTKLWPAFSSALSAAPF